MSDGCHKLTSWHDTVHECLNGRAPPYLSELCIPVSSADTRRHLRSANRHLLAVPRFRLNTYGRRAFSVAGPMAWNSLPDFIRDPTNSRDCFRRLLKTYLFARYYSASSALGVLNDYALYKSTHSVIQNALLYIARFCLATSSRDQSDYSVPLQAVCIVACCKPITTFRALR